MRSFLKEGPGLAGIAADFVLEGLQTGETALAPEEMPQLQGDGLAVQVAGIVQKPGLNGEAMAVYGGAGSDVGDGQIRSLRSACPAGIDALGGEEKLRRENLAEEQRILYVAMTRPKEKLILVDALYNATGRLQKLAAVAACPVLPETVAEGRTLGDWVLLPLLCRPEAAPLRAMAETEIDQLYIGEDRSWQVFLHDSEDYRERPARPQATAEETGETALFDPELLSFIYPYQRETALPAKVTATQLKGRPADQEIAEYAAHTPYLRPLSQPNFRRERQGLTPAERGTATHLVLQYLDFSNVDVAGQIEPLRQRSLLTDQQAAAVETAPLERFLRSPLAEEIRKSRSVLREYRFTLLMDARDYDPAAAAGEEILLQGVVDCCFETADGLTVVDFKTDRVFSALEVRQRAEHYRPQLEAYSRALERVLEKKVVRRALYFLAAGETMEI